MHIEPLEQNCSGCTACTHTCPHNAIKMKSNQHGFPVPVVDNEICIDCGLCITVCPQQNIKKNKRENIAYGFINTDDNIRSNSTSGGFFPALARQFIENGGYVCGCVLDEFKVKHIISKDWNDIKRMQGSKYVQSDMADCFPKISELLMKGYSILFTGTSCQIAGLNNYLSFKHIDDSLLLYVDFFCHGVPSPLIWREYINFINNKKVRATDYKFRSKRHGWGKKALGGDFLSYLEFNNGKIDEWSFKSRLWKYIFFSNLVIRDNCYSCLYASINKPSDITMADFWGIEKIDNKYDDGKGCSLVIAHSIKGNNYVKNCGNAKFFEVNINDAIVDQTNAFLPSSRNDLSTSFWEDYINKGFNYVLKKYFNYTLKGKVKANIKRLLFHFHIRYLY